LISIKRRSLFRKSLKVVEIMISLIQKKRKKMKGKKT